MAQLTRLPKGSRAAADGGVPSSGEGPAPVVSAPRAPGTVLMFKTVPGWTELCARRKQTAPGSTQTKLATPGAPESRHGAGPRDEVRLSPACGMEESAKGGGLGEP